MAFLERKTIVVRVRINGKFGPARSSINSTNAQTIEAPSSIIVTRYDSAREHGIALIIFSRRFYLRNATVPKCVWREKAKQNDGNRNFTKETFHTHILRPRRNFVNNRCMSTCLINANKSRIIELPRYLLRPAAMFASCGRFPRYNGAMPIKLIAMDIDGTLLDSHSALPRENLLAIQEAAARGIQIMLVTGRRFLSARQIAEGLGCDVELIVSNGALVKSMSGETHYRALLPSIAARQVMGLTREFREWTGVIFDRPAPPYVIFEKIDWEGPFVGPYLRKYREQVAEIEPLEDCLHGEDPVEVMFIGECGKIRQALRMLDPHRETFGFTLALTEYEHKGFSMLDALRPGVTKGAALAEWTRQRGIAPQDVMAIGDNWNDREMLEFAGVPVVMGNSVAELQSRGWAVTAPNDEAGVAEAIRTYALSDSVPQAR